MTEGLAFRANDAERETAQAPLLRLPQRDLPFASLAEGRTTASRPVHAAQHRESDPSRQASRAAPGTKGDFLQSAPRARSGLSGPLPAIARPRRATPWALAPCGAHGDKFVLQPHREPPDDR